MVKSGVENQMMPSFLARFCFTEISENSFKAGLADDEFNTSRYILFERLKEPDDQDVKFGFDAPHLEIDDQGNSGYGLIERVEMTSSLLTVHFNDQGIRSLQITAPFQVALGPNIQWDTLATVMNEIFRHNLVLNGIA